MPAQPTLTFVQLNDLLEENYEYIPLVMFRAISDILHVACDFDDQVMISTICWMLSETCLGAKSLSEIVLNFNAKTETTQSPHCAQYQAIMSELIPPQNNAEAMG
jgi:hypothetical protein